MRAWRWILATLLIGVVAAAPATAATGRTEALSPQTQTNLVAAAHGEAFAHAKYWAYAQEARGAGHPAIAHLFLQTSGDEFSDHFLRLAAMAGIVGSNAQNLRDAITGEGSEATTIYPGFAAQAKAQGDQPAAELWKELAGDEALHRDAFAQALQAITHPSSGVKVPAGPNVTPFPITAGQPQSTGVTLENLFATLHGESFANAKYMAYGLHARHTGNGRLAQLWQRTANVELMEHFAEAAMLAGLVGDTATNLRDAIKGEIDEATNVYIGYAQQAAAAGDHAAARLFAELAGDEAGHAFGFVQALQALELPR